MLLHKKVKQKKMKRQRRIKYLHLLFRRFCVGTCSLIE